MYKLYEIKNLYAKKNLSQAEVTYQLQYMLKILLELIVSWHAIDTFDNELTRSLLTKLITSLDTEGRATVLP